MTDLPTNYDEEKTFGRSSSEAESQPTLPVDFDPGTVLFAQDPQLRGRFTILRPHAAGGLGEVFVALDNELNREVALKQIQKKFGANERQQARFLLEAEVTGGLEHPGIVPVYSLGHDGDGRPFYAMRFIRGDSLKVAIEQFHRSGVEFGSLEFRNLLRRLIDVCNAIAYAHSRGVLHRDLKPGNIMLGPFGETLVVDWGLAKAMGSSVELSSGTLDPLSPSSGNGSGDQATLPGSTLGTPAYMSPEQAEGRLEELGPATDIYSLGATLYAMLVGKPAFAGSDVFELLGKVLEGDLAKPSALQPKVPKALENICLKAMSPEPARRYATALEMAADLERWLADEPVTAHRETGLERAKRWMRKHPGRVGSLASSAAIVVVGLAVASAMLGGKNRQLSKANEDLASARELAESKRHEAEGQRDRAVQAESLAKANAEKAARETAVAISVNDFLQNDLLRQADSRKQADDTRDANPNLTVRQALDRAAARISDRFRGQDLVEAEIRYAIGEAYIGIGESRVAIPHLERLVELRQAKLGAEHESTIHAKHSLALGYKTAGQLDRALPLLQQTFEHTKSKLGAEHRDTLSMMGNLAECYRATGEVAKAVSLLEIAAKATRATLGPEHPETLASMDLLAVCYAEAGDHAKAIPIYRETLRLSNIRLGPDHPDTVVTMNNLASALRVMGQLSEAVSINERALRIRKAKLGAEHPDTLASMNNAALDYETLGEFERAFKLYEEVLMIRKAKLGVDHPNTLLSMNNLAHCLQNSGQAGKALPILEEVLKLAKAKLGSEHPETLTSMHYLAKCYESLGRTVEATRLLETVVPLSKKVLGSEHPETISRMNALAVLYTAATLFDKSLPLLEETLRVSAKRLGDNHPSTVACMNNLAQGYRSAGRNDKALPLYEETVKRCRIALGSDHPNTLACMNNLASGYLAAKQLDKAIAGFDEVHRMRVSRIGADHYQTVQSLASLGVAKMQSGNAREAVVLLEDAYRRGKDAPQLSWVGSAYAEACEKTGQFAKAEPILLANFTALKSRHAESPTQFQNRISEIANRLVNLYDAWGKNAEAAKWREELSKFPKTK